MNADGLKMRFGDEYPKAVVMDGVRIPLSRETLFSRWYCSDDQKTSHVISRFMDGSTSITAGELQREWPTWTDQQRMDFCQSCCWLNQQSDFADMLRFIMQHGGPSDWSGIALSVASQLPRDEAFQTLLGALHAMDIGRCSNVTQAIAKTKHPAAEATLRHHLQILWADQTLWNNDDFLNWAAFDATTCIAHLIALGAPATSFENHVRRLSQHICPGNRDSCRNFLSKHYSWLKSAADSNAAQ